MAVRLHLVMALVLGASAARADNGLLYLGAGIANDNLQDVRVATTHSNISSTRWQAWAGVRPIGVFASCTSAIWVRGSSTRASASAIRAARR